MIIDEAKIRELLMGDDRFLKEFSEAAITSFREFADHYRTHLLSGNEAAFRRAGHKIKPVAIMIGATEIVQEYEHAKTLLWDERDEQELEASADRMDKLVSRLTEEFQHLAG